MHQITSIGRYINTTVKSVRLTVVIVLLLIVIYFLGLVLPQKWMFDSKLQYDEWLRSNYLNKTLDVFGLTDIYTSPLTIALLSLFFINLLVVIFNRVPLILRKTMLRRGPPEFNIGDIQKNKEAHILKSTVNTSVASERAKTYLKRRRWYISEMSTKGDLHAVKNRLSPIGFLLFHMSFLLCLVGGLLITYTRFSGKLVLTEGQTFDNDIRQFYEVTHDPKVFKMLPSLGLLVEDIKPVYEGEVPTELAVTVMIKYWDDVAREVLNVNEPIKRGPLSIIAENVGVSPLFVVRGPSGQELDASYVSLNVLKNREDHFQFDRDRRFTFYVRFFPDYVIKDGTETTRSIELKNPAIHLTVEKEGKSIFDGTIRPRERAQIDPFSISFDDVRYWVEFVIVREYGKSMLICGFLLASIGLIMRLVFYQKRLRFAFEEENGQTLVYIDGQSEYFGLSYREEMESLVDELEGFIKKHNDNND